MMIKEVLKKSFLAPVLKDTTLHIKRPYHQWLLWQDLAKTNAQVKDLRQTVFLKKNNKIVLIASLSDFIYQVKLESMLGMGLKELGWCPVILTHKLNTWARRYFKTFGFERFIYWEDVELSSSEKKQCINDSKQFLVKKLSFQSVKKWTFQGAWIGPQVLSSVVRENHLGTPNVTDPFIQGELTKMLPRSLEAVLKVEKILKTLKPEMVLVNEPNGVLMGPIVDLSVQKNLNVIVFVQPARDDTLILKKLTPQTRRMHPLSLTPETFKKVATLQWTHREEEELTGTLESRYNGKYFLQNRNQPNVVTKSRQQLIEELGLNPSKKTAVIFSGVLWDANLFYGEDLFEDYGDWFIQSIGAACENPHLNWIVKLHPANIWKRARDKAVGELAENILIKKHMGELPSHIKLLFPETQISTLSLFKTIDYGINVRGTVGIELPCFGVPTLTAGTGRYSGLGFTIDSATKEEYLHRLSEIHTYSSMTQEQVLLAKKHAYAIFKLRQWEMKSFKAVFHPIRFGSQPLDHNLVPKFSTINEIRKQKDLHEWACWAENRESIDYLREFK